MNGYSSFIVLAVLVALVAATPYGDDHRQGGYSHNSYSSGEGGRGHRRTQSVGLNHQGGGLGGSGHQSGGLGSHQGSGLGSQGGGLGGNSHGLGGSHGGLGGSHGGLGSSHGTGYGQSQGSHHQGGYKDHGH